MSNSEAIINTVRQRTAQKAQLAQNAKRNKRRAASDPGGLHAEERETATLNESARQLDTSMDVERENFPSTWRRATALEAPPPRPGFVQRWVRTKSNGVDDTENYDRYITEGWRPRKPSTVPRGHSLATTKSDKNGQLIVKKGHVLMETTEDIKRQRDAFYSKSLDRQTKAVEQELFTDNKGHAGRVMPLTDATVKSRAALARRRPRAAADDDNE